MERFVVLEFTSIHFDVNNHEKGKGCGCCKYLRDKQRRRLKCWA
jgi:hypothetical protein